MISQIQAARLVAAAEQWAKSYALYAAAVAFAGPTRASTKQYERVKQAFTDYVATLIDENDR